MYIRYNSIYKDKEAVKVTTTINRWGNSSAVRIPRNILSQANFEEGTHVEIISPKEGEIILRAVRKRKTLREIFAEENSNDDFLQTEELDWGEPQGEEIW